MTSRLLRLPVAVLVAFAAGCRGPAPPAAGTPSVGRAPLAAEGDELLAAADETLDATARERIRDYLRFVRASYGVDYRVALEPMPPFDDEGIVQLAATRFLATGIGDDTAGRGLLLWIDPEARRTRVEVGYALEPFLTDLDASHLVADYLAPWFASGQIGAGIEASIEALVEAIRPQLAAIAEAAPDVEGSGGAGAARTLEVATPSAAPHEDELTAALVPQPDPRAARELELDQLRQGRYSPRSALYDDAWRRQAPRGRWPAARLRAIAALWTEWEIQIEGERAVAFCPSETRAGPTLLRREPDGWIIDATAGARLVVYDYGDDGWYFLDGDSDYLPLLRTALPMERVALRSGRAAWRPSPR